MTHTPKLTGLLACFLLFLIAALLAIAGWVNPQPDGGIWSLRIGGTFFALGALACGIYLVFRKDKAPDYLYTISKNYYNRKGMCFHCQAVAENGTMYLETYFQNQYDQPCTVNFALRPAKPSFGKRPPFPPVLIPLDCGPAAFGLVRTPLPVPLEMQGKRQKFEIGAHAQYPEEKKRPMRFRNGKALQTNDHFVSDQSASSAFAVAGLVGLIFAMLNKDFIKLNLPADVQTELPPDTQPEVMTLWELGDPPLEDVSPDWHAELVA